MTRWREENDDIPTSRLGKGPRSKHSDTDYTVGQLMVESLNHRHRIQVLEERLSELETSAGIPTAGQTGSVPPSERQRLFALVRKTVTTTALVIAALISALKELGYLK
jgi:hypothetical protein